MKIAPYLPQLECFYNVTGYVLKELAFIIVPNDTTTPETLPETTKNSEGKSLGVFILLGAGNRTRTYDPRITNALLYQLSYTGVSP